MTNILVINLTRFGDIIQSLPMIQGLKKKYPDSRLCLMVNSNFSQVCCMIPDVDDLLELDFVELGGCLLGENPCIEEGYGYLKNFFEKLREKKFDHIINITPHDIGIISSFLAGEKSLFWSKISDWTMYYLNITRHWETLPFNVVDIYIKLAGLVPGKIVPKLYISDDAYCFARRFLQQEGLKQNGLLIGFHPGASSLEKQWPAEYFLELGNLIKKNLNAQLILFGAESDEELGESLVRNLHGQVINAIGKTSVMELAALMSQTHILITNDTGPMHVASACGAKVISIHIGKEKCVSTGPYGEGHIALHPKLVCHPCKRPEECPNRSCRDLIAPGLVFDMVKFLLKGKNELSSADVETEMNKADIFISGFDEGGLLDFFPLWKSELTLSVLCSRFLRFMWDMSLSKNLADSELDRSIDRCTHELISITKRYYFIEDIVHLKSRWEKAYRSLENLSLFAQQGSLLARELQQTAHNAVKNIKTLQELSKEIGKLDEKIISLGETFQEIATLTHMFSFEKESLHGDHVINLTRQTDSIYRKLLRRCKILKKIGNSFFDKLPVTDNVEKQKFKYFDNESSQCNRITKSLNITP